MKIPNINDIAPRIEIDKNQSLAAKEFLGVGRSEAEEMYKENLIYYSDLLFDMGVNGFVYYAFPFIDAISKRENDLDVLISVMTATRCCNKIVEEEIECPELINKCINAISILIKNDCFLNKTNKYIYVNARIAIDELNEFLKKKRSA